MRRLEIEWQESEAELHRLWKREKHSERRLRLRALYYLRQGKQIKYKGWFRDPLRSTAAHVVTTLGLRLDCLAVLVAVPWSKRTWSLPFITVLR